VPSAGVGTNMTLFFQWLVAAAYLLAAGMLIVCSCRLVACDRRPQIERVAVVAASIGLLIHIAMVVVRGLDSGQVPVMTRYEDFTVDALSMASVWLLAQWRWPQLRPSGVLVLSLAAFVVIAALSYSRGVFPMSPALRTNWLVIHASLNSLAIGFGTVALAVGLMLKEDRMDLLGRFMSWTFLFWCGMVAAGSYWASIAWGRFWGWDPIECWSLGTIFIYAFVLHLRMKPKWRKGYRSAVMGVVPFSFMMFTTYGLVFVMRSVHGQYVFQ